MNFNCGKVNSVFPSVADIGDREILGMNGSLTSYIYTGNPQCKNVYVNSRQKNHSKKSTVSNMLLGGCIALGSVFLGSKLIKKIPSLFKVVKK